MTTVFVVGGNSDCSLEGLIKSELADNYRITYVKDSEITQLGSGYELLVIDTERLTVAELSECIVLMKKGGIAPEATLPLRSVVIADSANKRQLDGLKHCRCLTCGALKTDTFTCSSVSDEDVVVSLGREFTALSGKKILPLDIPRKIKGQELYSVMALTALRLVLDDSNSELGALY